VGLCVAPQRNARARVGGDVELLKLTANTYQANREKIDTWTCEADITTSRTVGGVVQFSGQMHCTFVFSKALGAHKWQVRQQDSYRAKDGHVVVNRPEVRNGMTKDDMSYRMDYFESAARPFNLVIQSRQEAVVLPRLVDFDPFSYMHDLGRGDVHDMLMTYAAFSGPQVFASVERNGDMVILKEGGEGCSARREFDLARGGNVVLYRLSQPEKGYLDEDKCDFESVSGVFVPKEITLKQQREAGTPQEMVIDWHIVLTKNAVNGAVDPSEFTLLGLGLRPGDYVHDRRLEGVYQYPPLSKDMDLLDSIEREASLNNKTP
jgi:hypothetical protein